MTAKRLTTDTEFIQQPLDAHLAAALVANDRFAESLSGQDAQARADLD